MNVTIHSKSSSLTLQGICVVIPAGYESYECSDSTIPSSLYTVEVLAQREAAVNTVHEFQYKSCLLNISSSRQPKGRTTLHPCISSELCLESVSHIVQSTRSGWCSLSFSSPLVQYFRSSWKFLRSSV